MRRESDSVRLPQYEAYVAEYGADSGRELATHKGTARDWCPYRFCSGDWLLSVAVARASRTRFEVGLFLAEEHTAFEEFAGVKAGLSFLLADCFHRTGRMAIRFSGPRRGDPATLESGFERRIPKTIREYAESVGVELRHRAKIDHSEGQALYLRLARFSPEIVSLMTLAKCDPVRAAFLVHRGVWSAVSLEYMLKASANVNSILMGDLHPENWLRFKRELLIMRTALMAERVVTLLESGGQQELSDIKLSWLQKAAVSTMSVVAKAAITLQSVGEQPLILSSGVEVEVRLAARDASDLQRSAELDHAPGGVGVSTILTVTKDFDWTSEQYRHDTYRAQKQRVYTVKIVDTLDELDSEILMRLSRAATTRMAVEGKNE